MKVEAFVYVELVVMSYLSISFLPDVPKIRLLRDLKVADFNSNRSVIIVLKCKADSYNLFHLSH